MVKKEEQFGSVTGVVGAECRNAKWKMIVISK